MTKDERRFLRSCICNGFDFKCGTETVTASGQQMSTERFEEIINEVEDALNKQEAKKPTDVYVCIPVMGTCPVCGVRLDDTMKHCYYCGQALDWNLSENPTDCGGDNHATD